MPKLPIVSADEVIKALTKNGFIKVRQVGSHIAMQKKIDDKTNTVIVPNHKELAIGTFRSIIRKSGLAREDFLKLL